MCLYYLVVQKDATAGLELILVHEAEDGDVMLAPHAGAHYGVVVVDDLLEVADTHRCSSQVVNLAALLLVLLLLGLQTFLIPRVSDIIELRELVIST